MAANIIVVTECNDVNGSRDNKRETKYFSISQKNRE